MNRLSRTGLSLRGAIALHGWIDGIIAWFCCRRDGHFWVGVHTYNPYAFMVTGEDEYIARTHMKLRCVCCCSVTLISVTITQSGGRTTIYAPDYEAYLQLT